MAKSVVFVISQKGGVGKSTFARALVELLRAERSDVAAYDADGNVGQLLQYLGTRDARGKLEPVQDPVKGVGFFDVRLEAERGDLVNLLETLPEIAVVDLPGGSVGDVSEVLGGTEHMVSRYRKAGYAIYVVLVITHMKAGVYAVDDCMRSFGPLPHYIVVKNLAFADSEDFVFFDGYVDRENGDPERGYRVSGKSRDELIGRGGEVIEMPEMPPRTYGQLDSLDMPFFRGAQSRDLTFQQRAHCEIFLERFAAEVKRSRLRELFGAELSVHGAAVGD